MRKPASQPWRAATAIADEHTAAAAQKHATNPIASTDIDDDATAGCAARSEAASIAPPLVAQPLLFQERAIFQPPQPQQTFHIPAEVLQAITESPKSTETVVKSLNAREGKMRDHLLNILLCNL